MGKSKALDNIVAMYNGLTDEQKKDFDNAVSRNIPEQPTDISKCGDCKFYPCSLTDEHNICGKFEPGSCGVTVKKEQPTDDVDEEIAFDDPNQRNLVSDVSCKKVLQYGRGQHRILLVDCGVKHNIIRCLLKYDTTVIRVPWDYDFSEEKIDGVIISNGPGDPRTCDKTIKNVRNAISDGIPILGICLGSQILALAAGASTYKLKYGHRSHNQPCIDSSSHRCYITSQNHGYAIKSDTLPVDWREWFSNNNDGTNEGIIHISKPFFGAQFHPEASPGPDDTEFLFDMFVRAMK